METDTVVERLEAYMEKLEGEKNDAIEKLTSYMDDHSSLNIPCGRKKEIIRERVIRVFIVAEFTVHNDPDSVPLTAEDCRRLADRAGVDPDVNRKPFQRAYQFIYENLRDFCDAPEEGLENMLEICFRQFMSTRVWGSERPQPPAPIRDDTDLGYSDMLHGKATDAIASMTGKPLIKDNVSNTASIENMGVKMVLSEYSKMAGSLGVSTHQLLSKIITEFTKINHTDKKIKKAKELRVVFSLNEFLYLLGYDVYEHPTQTDEEKKAEKNRVRIEKNNGRNKVKSGLDFLWKASLSWSETVFGKEESFLDLRIIGGKGIIKNGYVYVELTQSMGDYLVQRPLTQYPDALYRVDGNHASAYAIGLKMWEQYNLYNNQTRNTAQLLKVKTLLKETKLPTYESLGKNRLDWKLRIKEPLEDILEYLVQTGVIDDWRYSHSKGVEMTDEEATSFSGYEEWAETLVYFTLKNAPDHTARLEAKEEEKKEAIKKKSISTQKALNQ